MAKKQTAKMPKAKSSRTKGVASKRKQFFVKHRIFGILLIVVGVWALVWLGQAAVERYNFYRVEKRLDDLSSRLEQSDNLTDRYKAHTCNYSSVAYGRGTLRCSIYLIQVLDAENIDKTNSQAKNLLEKFKIDKSVDPNSLSTNDKRSFSEDDFAFESTFHDISYSFKFNNLNLTCSYILRPIVGSVHNLKVLIGCTNKSKFPYFSVRD